MSDVSGGHPPKLPEVGPLSPSSPSLVELPPGEEERGRDRHKHSRYERFSTLVQWQVIDFGFEAHTQIISCERGYCEFSFSLGEEKVVHGMTYGGREEVLLHSKARKMYFRTYKDYPNNPATLRVSAW